MQPGFRCSSVSSKRTEEGSADLQLPMFWAQIFCIAGAGIEPTTSPAIDVALAIGSPPSTS